MLTNSTDVASLKNGEQKHEIILQIDDLTLWVFAIGFICRKYSESNANSWREGGSGQGMGQIQQHTTLARVKSKKHTGINRGSTNRKQSSSFLQRSWTCAISKFSELDKKLQKCKGRVVLRDDARSNAIFTEQSYFATARLHKRSHRRCLSIHSVKHGRCHQFDKITEKAMPSNLDAHTTTSKLLVIGQCDRSCGTIGKKLVSSLWTRTGKSTKMGRIKMHRKSGFFFQFTWTT